MNQFKGQMKLPAILLLFILAFASAKAAPDAKKGKALFDEKCTSCHQPDKKMIGPNLTGVKGRWSNNMKKLEDWVHDPSKFLGKDPYAIKLQADNGGTVMSSFPDLSNSDIDNILEYINNPSALVEGPNPGNPTDNYMPVPPDNSFLRVLLLGSLVLIIIIFYLASRIWNSFKKEDEDHDGFDGPSKGINLQRLNAWLMPIFGIVFIGGLLYECSIHLTPKYVLPEAASDIGQRIDKLFMNTVYITAIVFFVTQILLFYYSFKYQKREGRKAYYYPHNNTIEFVWTIIPAIVLSYLVLDGFMLWRDATKNPDDKPFEVEAFAKQFEWNFRYPGPDGVLGRTDFRKISGTNPLGIDFDDPASKDDYITQELHMIKGKPVRMKLRSQDVIHDAYLPHFRMNLYAQPGMDNLMRFTPIYTTEEMRAKTDNPKFDYELACNQLCGAAHYNMRRVVVVEDEKDFMKWQSSKKAAFASYKPEAAKLSASIK